MIPTADAALRTLMMTILSELAPNLPAGYLQSSANIVALAQMFAAEEFDRAAEVRSWENSEMRRLCAAGVPVVADSNLRDRLQLAADSRDESLRVSLLEVANNDLRRRLIELHAAVESSASEAARQLEGDIWRFLRTSAKRRAFTF